MVDSKYVWHQGELVDFKDATVHFLNSSLHYGTAVFEGIRAYGTDDGAAIFRLKDHIKRLRDSAKIIGFTDLPYSEEEMYQACLDVVRANELEDCYIRPLIYIVDGGWNLLNTDITIEYSVAAWKWDKYMGEEALKHGIRAKISSFTRHYVNSAMTKAKVSGNYVNSVLARSEVVKQGYEEAILLDSNGLVSECTGQNLFVVRKGKLMTPPSYSVLEGITRESVIELAEDLGYDVHETVMTRDQLYVADEVFMVGTANEVIAVREIDDRQIGNGSMGELTAKIQEDYANLVRGKIKKYDHHLDHVNANKEAPVFF